MHAMADAMTHEGRVLITGATGFVGGHLIAHLRAAHPHWWAITGTTLGERSAVPHPEGTRWQSAEEGAEIVPCDLRDAAATADLVARVRPDAVFHLAGQSNVPISFADPEDTLTNNITGVLHLLEACRAHAPAARLLIVSSAEVYGPAPPEAQPLREDRALRPVSPYAVSKAAVEMLALQYAHSYGQDVVVARPFNHVGPGQTEKFVVSRFAREIARIERGEQEVLRVGNLTAARDFSDVRDIVRAYDTLIERGERGGVYNIGRGEAITVEAVLDTLRGLATVPVRTEVDPAIFRPSDAPLLVADTARVRSVGWEPRIPFAQTASDILNDWRRVLAADTDAERTPA